MPKPSFKSPCVANGYAGPHERIAEFSFSNGKGGLIALRESDDDTMRVDVYRCDPGIIVTGPQSDAARAMLAALEDVLRFMPAIPPHDPNRYRLDMVKSAIALAKAAGIKPTADDGITARK